MPEPTPASSEPPSALPAAPEPVTAPADGADDSGSDDDDATGAADAPKKKKKKPKKKKKAAGKPVQSDPPRVGLSSFFAPDAWPHGEEQDYTGANSGRKTSEEKRYLERQLAQLDPMDANNYNSVRRAAEVHRQVRRFAQRSIKPGMKLMDAANLIEDTSRALVEEDGLSRGIGFPTGLNLNHCAAHYSPNPGETSIEIKSSDVLKVDFGVQVSGRIVDSAFTMSWEPTYDKLLEAVREATNTGIREAGIDVRVADIGAAIQETMESYEVEIKDSRGVRTLPVKSIRNLTGHNILPYRIHGGKSVPIVKTHDTDVMEEGEIFAIETFGSTGRGHVVEEGSCSHFAKIPDVTRPLRMQSAKSLLAVINKEFGTLPFCRRYLERAGASHHLLGLKSLVENGIVQDYPPLCDEKGSQTAQFEHTIILRPTVKEVVSRFASDPDY